MIQQLIRPLFCTIGVHSAPQPRVPHGPIVATCPCCKKTVYYYGLSAYGLSKHPSLALSYYPRPLAAMPMTPAHAGLLR